MKSSTKWVLIFGSGAAIANFTIGFITSLCGLIFSPIATGLATYLVLKEKPIMAGRRVGIQIGLLIGAIGSIGTLIGAGAASIFWNIPLLALATMHGVSSSSDIVSVVGAGATSAFFLIALALLVSVLSVGLCVATGVIVGVGIASRMSVSKPELRIKHTNQV